MDSLDDYKKMGVTDKQNNVDRRHELSGKVPWDDYDAYCQAWKDTAVIPTKGMGVTQIVGSDRYPFTIVEVVNDHKIVVTKDSTSPNKRQWPDQDYDYTSNPDGYRTTLTLRKGNVWREVGESVKGGSPWHVGSRRLYQDPDF